MLEKVIRYQTTKQDRTTKQANDYVWERLQDIQGGKVTGEPSWYAVFQDKLVPVQDKIFHVSLEGYQVLLEKLKPETKRFKGVKMPPEEVRRLADQIYLFCSEEDYRGNDGKLVLIIADEDEGSIKLVNYGVKHRVATTRERGGIEDDSRKVPRFGIR